VIRIFYWFVTHARTRGGWCWCGILSPVLNLIVQFPKFFAHALRQAGFTTGRGLHHHAVMMLASRLKQMFAFVIDDPAEHYRHRKRYDSDARKSEDRCVQQAHRATLIKQATLPPSSVTT
jgi:hypothetical protein